MHVTSCSLLGKNLTSSSVTERQAGVKKQRKEQFFLLSDGSEASPVRVRVRVRAWLYIRDTVLTPQF